MKTLDWEARWEADNAVCCEREQAREQVPDWRDLGAHAVAYAAVNLLLITVWAFTGAGYFWPVWVLAAWGVGLVLHAAHVFARRPITEADIDGETQRHRR